MMKTKQLMKIVGVGALVGLVTAGYSLSFTFDDIVARPGDPVWITGTITLDQDEPTLMGFDYGWDHWGELALSDDFLNLIDMTGDPIFDRSQFKDNVWTGTLLVGQVMADASGGAIPGYLTIQRGADETSWVESSFLVNVVTDPVPEPASLAALAIGLGTLLTRRKRKSS